MLRFLPLTFAACIVAGCVTSSTTMLVEPEKYPPVPADSVQVFASEDELKENGYEYEAVALLDAGGGADYTNDRMIVNELRQEAAKIGANGIVLVELEGPSFTEGLLGAIVGAALSCSQCGSGGTRSGKVVAVRWWIPAKEPEGQIRI
jgi:hypothetical protein